MRKRKKKRMRKKTTACDFVCFCLEFFDGGRSEQLWYRYDREVNSRIDRDFKDCGEGGERLYGSWLSLSGGVGGERSMQLRIGRQDSCGRSRILGSAEASGARVDVGCLVGGGTSSRFGPFLLH